MISPAIKIQPFSPRFYKIITVLNATAPDPTWGQSLWRSWGKNYHSHFEIHVRFSRGYSSVAELKVLNYPNKCSEQSNSPDFVLFGAWTEPQIWEKCGAVFFLECVFFFLLDLAFSCFFLVEFHLLFLVVWCLILAALILRILLDFILVLLYREGEDL